MLPCFDMTFDGIATALRKRPTLRSVSFSNTVGPVDRTRQSTYITSQFISSLVCLKYLTSLHLLSSNISDELLSSVACEGLPLTRLVLQDCTSYIAILESFLCYLNVNISNTWIFKMLFF
jgi:hypothetical protein